MPRGGWRRSPPRRPRPSPMPAVDFTPPWRRVTLRDGILEQSGIDVMAARGAQALGAAIARRGLGVETDGRSVGDLVDDLLSTAVEPTLHRADVRVRLSRRAVAVRQGAPLARRGSSSAGRPTPAASRSPTPSPSSTTPTSSARGSSRSARRPRPATTRRSRSTRRSSPRSSRGCRRPGASAWHRPPRDAAVRPADDPRGGPVSGAPGPLRRTVSIPCGRVGRRRRTCRGRHNLGSGGAWWPRLCGGFATSCGRSRSRCCRRIGLIRGAGGPGLMTGCVSTRSCSCCSRGSRGGISRASLVVRRRLRIAGSRPGRGRGCGSACTANCCAG